MLHITTEKNRLQQRKQRPPGAKSNSFHNVELLRRQTSRSQPISGMLATVF